MTELEMEGRFERLGPEHSGHETEWNGVMWCQWVKPELTLWMDGNHRKFCGA